MIKTSTFIGVIVVVLVVSAIAIYIALQPNDAPKVVEIFIDKEKVQTIDLSTLTEEQEIVFSHDGLENVVVLDSKGVYMKHADCPDKICVKQGKINSGTFPIVCLPNKFVIEIKHKEQAIDAISK